MGPEKRDALLGNARLLLHPINFNEPFGLSIIEAMACGTPVVAFNKGCIFELIEDGRNGFLVENPEEVIDKIKKIDSIDRADCRKTVSGKFSKEIMAKNYIAVYNEILKNK